MSGAAPSRPLVIVTEHLDDECRAWLAERADVRVEPPESPGFASLASRASGLVVRTYTRVDAALLDRLPKLRVVGRAGVGLDSIDLDACRRRGVRVVHTPGANTGAVVEFVLAAILDALRPRLYLHEALDAPRWKSLRRELTAPRELGGLTLGVLGLGRIGSRVAAAGAPLFARTIFHDVRDIPPADRAGASPVALDELLRTSDVLSVHVDGRSANRGLLGAGALALLRPAVVLINTSRGFVIDPIACAEFMLSHPSACAVLDVHEPEPLSPACPLLDLKNVHLSPHIAGATAPAQRAMSWVVRDVWRVLSGQAPECPAI